MTKLGRVVNNQLSGVRTIHLQHTTAWTKMVAVKTEGVGGWILRTELIGLANGLDMRKGAVEDKSLVCDLGGTAVC